MHSQHFWVFRFIVFELLGEPVCDAFVWELLLMAVCVRVDSKLEGRPSRPTRRNKIYKTECMQEHRQWLLHTYVISGERCRRNAKRWR